MTLARKLIASACLTLGLLLVAYELFLMVLYSRPDAVLRCLHRVPDGLPEGTPLESLTPEARLSLFPLGLECTYSYGGVTAVATPDWTDTALAALAIALVAVGVGIITLSRTRTSRIKPRP